MSEHAGQLHSFAEKLGGNASVHDLAHIGWGVAIGDQVAILVGHSDGAVIASDKRRGNVLECPIGL